jgi:Fic family protein
MFVLDFLCIHPFNDGNGRMSRLLTLLLLYRSGYVAGKYISIEMLIEKSKETYYEALQESSYLWHKSENNYLPFLRYYLGVTIKACREFQDRIEHLQYRNQSKLERIKAVFNKKTGKTTKAEILSLCPDISQTTVERTLNDLLKSGYIEKTGQGKSTGYIRMQN